MNLQVKSERVKLNQKEKNNYHILTHIYWPPHAKSWLIGKDRDAGRDWGQEEKAGWHHWLDGCEFGWTLAAGDGQGGLVCCDSWGHKESEMTKRLNWTEINEPLNFYQETRGQSPRKCEMCENHNTVGMDLLLFFLQMVPHISPCPLFC